MKDDIEKLKKHEQCLCEHRGKMGTIEKIYKARKEDFAKAKIIMASGAVRWVPFMEVKVLS